jgi:membrane protein implicated in regulation of membrane protease activity
MEAYWIWWLMVVALVIAEMFSGTFYLLAIALGLAAAGWAAWVGVAWGGQMAMAAMICSACVFAIYRWRRVRANPKTNLAYDIGQDVQVSKWLDERHARVAYRGAEWDAMLAEGCAPDVTRMTWRIKQLAGSRLIIE